MADTLSGVTGGFTIANTSPTFNFTNGTHLDIDAWQADIKRASFRRRRFGTILPKVSVVNALTGRVRVRFQAISGTTPPIPVVAGTVGDMTLTLASGRTYTGKGVCLGLTIDGTSSGEVSPWEGWYDFEFTDNGSTDTITAS